VEPIDTNLLEWKPVKGNDKVYEKILNYDDESGEFTRLLKLEPNAEIPDVAEHDFWEETIILKGTLTDKRLNKVFSELTYECIPPHTKHGPYASNTGCIIFEIRTRGTLRSRSSP
jgi:anti-sigma factor ChrR (cupin superfamily)